MAYSPLGFDREGYLRHSDIFENEGIQDADEELCEFSDDTEALAYEVAYLRYHYAKQEAKVARLRKLCKDRPKPVGDDRHFRRWLDKVDEAGREEG